MEARSIEAGPRGPHTGSKGGSLRRLFGMVGMDRTSPEREQSAAEHEASSQRELSYEALRHLSEVDIGAFQRALAKVQKYSGRLDKVKPSEKLVIHQGIAELARVRLITRHAAELHIEHPHSLVRLRLHANDQGNLDQISFVEPFENGFAAREGTTKILPSFVPYVLEVEGRHEPGLRQENSVGVFSDAGINLGTRIEPREPHLLDLISLEPLLAEGREVARQGMKPADPEA